jgi:hypothetical protein
MDLRTVLENVFFNENLREFPANLDNLHNQVTGWVRSHVTNSAGSFILRQPSLDRGYSVLKNAISNAFSEEQILRAWTQYFENQIFLTTFLPGAPVATRILPQWSISTNKAISKFNNSIDRIRNKESLVLLDQQLKTWITNQNAMEFWSIPSPTGPVPAPPILLPLKIIGA